MRRGEWRTVAGVVGVLVLAGCSASGGGVVADDSGTDVAIGQHEAGRGADGGHRADGATRDAHAKPDAGADVGARDAGGHDAGAEDGETRDTGARADAGPSCGGSGAWTLVWSDEFNGADGTGIDTTKWAAQTGGTGWGNQEREYYTNDLANAEESGGNLVITATTAGAAGLTCWYGQCLYTSARLQTLGLFAEEYGRFEARIKIPGGQGLWPAFWMLGSNIDTVSWPTCGEIDVMENIGKEPGTVHGSMHGPSDAGATNVTASYTLDGSASFADGFHVFAVEWETGVVRFYVDETLYETVTPADDPAGATWVFDQPFFLLLNVAVGGSWPGDPDGTTVFPQTMLVDYVRVCQ
jgi:beta-glucanase (GH16 family)